MPLVKDGIPQSGLHWLQWLADQQGHETGVEQAPDHAPSAASSREIYKRSLEQLSWIVLDQEHTGSILGR